MVNFYRVINPFYKIFLELFILNKTKRRALKGRFCQAYLKKYIKDIESEKCELSMQADKKYRIWQYWDSGIENAPDIVRACMASVEKYSDGIERVILNETNIKDYVEIPDYIYKLKERGIISSAHFSDILRTFLLYEHGGCWIDATVLMTAPLPDFVRSADLFVLKNNKAEDPDRLNMTNYFISSRGNSVILAKMKRFLEKYWSENRGVLNYFFYAHAFTLFTDSSEENRNEWGEMPNYSYLVVQQMEKRLLEKYSKAVFIGMEQNSFIHKLSYKKKVIVGRKSLNLADTVYQYIVDSYVQPDEYKGFGYVDKISIFQKLKSLIGYYFSFYSVDEHYILKLFGIKFCKKHRAALSVMPKLISSGVCSEKRKRKIIVSLTTYPARINTVYKTISTLLCQTIKPDEVILWLAEEQFEDKVLPDNLTNLETFGLKIRWCEDIKSYKKLIPTLRENPDDIIITVDDDYYYDNRLIEELYNAYLLNPKSIHARQAFVVCSKDKEFYLKSRSYIYDDTYLENYKNEPVGCGGVLYPPHSLHENVLNTAQCMSEIPTHDDLWFWSHALRRGTKISVLKNAYELKNILVEGSQADSLWQKNMINSTSKVGMTGKQALNKLCKMFPEIVDKLK